MDKTMTLKELRDDMASTGRFGRWIAVIDAHLASQPAEQPRGEVPACERCGECRRGNFGACKNRQHFTAQPKPEQAVGDGVADAVSVYAYQPDRRQRDGWTYGVSAHGVGIAEGLSKAKADALAENLTVMFKCRASTPRPAVATPAEVTDEASVLRAELQHMVRAYVRLLEVGRDRIVDLGGSCDPLDVMEQADPHLIQAKRALALTAQCQVRKDTQGLDVSGRLTPLVPTSDAVIAAADVYERERNSGATHDQALGVALSGIESPSAGAVVPDRITAYEAKKRGWLKGPKSYAAGWNACLDALAAAPEVPQP